MRAPRPEVPRARALGVLAVLLLALSVVCGSVFVTGWWTARAVPGFGAELQDPGPEDPELHDEASAGPQPPATAPSPVVRHETTTPATVPAAEPVRLEIPELGISAPVVPVEVDEAGAMALPDDPAVLGWYRWGPVPGAAGRAVIAGHVDTRTDGPGALFDLRIAPAGTVVRVTYADEDVREFAVNSRQNYGKEELPTSQVFARTGPPELVLITCGGAFDSAAGSYEENVVVSAAP